MPCFHAADVLCHPSLPKLWQHSLCRNSIAETTDTTELTGAARMLPHSGYLGSENAVNITLEEKQDCMAFIFLLKNLLDLDPPLISESALSWAKFHFRVNYGFNSCRNCVTSLEKFSLKSHERGGGILS